MKKDQIIDIPASSRPMTGKPKPMPNPKEVDFTTILAAASGSGMLGGSILGLGGALVGGILGAGFGYWAQVSGNQAKNKGEQVREKALTH